MKEYHKIETLFTRDMEGNKKLIEGSFRNPAIEYLKDLQWNFTEKVDGTNVRVHWDGHTVIFGGRTDNAQMPTVLLYALQEKFSGTVNEQLFEEKFGGIPVTLYGEGFGGKIQSGGKYKKEQGFILFDVMIDDLFLERENVEDIARAFDIPIVPVVLVGTIQEAVDYVKAKPNSTIAVEERESEGLVGTPLVPLYDRRGNRVVVKVKVSDFS